jgi:hypothetical protein
MNSQDVDDAPAASGPTEADRRLAIDALRGDDAGWSEPESALEFGELRWQPDLVRDGAVLHLCLTSEVPNAWLRRMDAAAAADRDVTFATTTLDLPISALRRIQRIDARVVWVDTSRSPTRVRKYRSIADLVARERLYLEPDGLKLLAGDRLQDALATSNTSRKGRWYEEALCLVFSQVSWLTVDKHAYHNATEEIDLLMGCHAIGHVDRLVGGAVVLATAKNESKATDSQTVKYLKQQMANRKGRCKLGFLCSASKLSSGATAEILRGTPPHDAVIVPLDRAALEKLLADADELSRRVEDLILEAVAD